MAGRNQFHRVRRIVSTLAVLLIIGALLLACGEADENLGPANGSTGSGEQSSPTATTLATPVADAEQIEHPTSEEELVLRVEMVGGFVLPETLVTRVPMFSLYGDGCYVVEGPQIEIYPPPALPNLQEVCLTEEGVQEVLRRAQEVGLLDQDAEYELPTVADAPTTVFTVNAEGKTVVTSAYALGLDEVPDPNMPEEEREARQELAEFQQWLTSLQFELPEGMIGEPEHPYDIQRMQVVALPADSPSAPVPPEEIELQTLEWPLETSLAELGEPYTFIEGSRCAVIEGEQLATLMEQLQQANTLTRWTSEGQEFSLIIRPLLPDQTGCETPTLQ